MLVLLDLDGTLTDPYAGITGCVSYAVERLGLPPLSDSQLRAFIGPPLQDQFTSLGLDEATTARAVELYRERFSTTGLYENRVYDGIPEALEALAVQHRLAVATSKPTSFAERILRHFALDAHLELVAGATLDGTRRAKADIIAFALEALHVDAAHAVMVGDRAQDVAGARAHGMRSIGVRWGYAEPGELAGAGAEELATTPDDLVRILRR